MKISNILLSLLLLTLTPSVCLGETITLFAKVPTEGGRGYSAETVTLEDGDVAVVLSCFSFVDTSYPSIALEIAGEPEVYLKAFVSDSNNSLAPASQTWTIEGPAVIRATIFGYAPSAGRLSFLTLAVSRTVDEDILVQENAVVIPNGTDEDVMVLLESSTDLINWYQTSPGFYSFSNSPRYFRVRLVNQ